MALLQQHGRVQLFGNTLVKSKSQKGGALAHYPAEQWFVKEEVRRSINSGHVFFIHAKVLLIDPLSNDPLICTGSANFSKNSLIANDENMLLIRGETRVADIYISEIDRIFRHFFARNAVNDIATRTKGKGKNPNWLDPGFGWIDSNFDPSSYKCARRLTFFPDGAQSLEWAAKAKFDPDPFIDEAERPAKWRKEAAERRAKAGGL
jgi:phosphatidylserine/phosphatidylglycerophosphate/cardiolipin synthase-like enzyme